MAGRLFFPFPLHASHTSSAYLLLLPPLPLTAYLSFFSSSVSSSRLTAYEGTYGWRHCTTSPSFCFFSLCAERAGSSFSSIAFGYRGINYPLVPSVHYLPSCICLLEIVRGKRIPFSPEKTSRIRELLDLSTCPAAVCRRGQYYSCIAFAIFLFYIKLLREWDPRDRSGDVQNFMFDITEYDICIFIYIDGFYNLV